MALTTEEKRKYLTTLGKNPDEFDIDDNTLEAVPKIKVQPSINSGNGFTPNANAVIPKPTQTPLETFGRNAATGVAPALAGAGAWALAAPFAPATGGASLLVPLVASIAAGIGTHKIQEKVLESTESGKEFLQKTAEGNQINPKSAVAGNLAASLPIMRPSVGMLRDASKAIVGSKIRDIPQQIMRSPAASNVALGTAMGTGQGIYDELQDPNPLNLGRLGLNIAGGALMNKPADNKLARMVGVTPYVRDPRLGDYEGGLAIDKLVPKPTISQELNPADIYTKERGPAFLKKGETTSDKIVGLKGYKETDIPQDVARMEAEGGQPLLSREEQIEIREAQRRQEDYKKAKEELAIEERRAAELATNEALKLKVQNDLTELGKPLAKDNIPAPKATSELGKEIYPDYTGVQEHDLQVNARESAEDLAMRRAEGYTGDKYAIGGQEKVKGKAKPIEQVKVLDEEVIGQRAKDLGARHGIDVETLPGESFTSTEGRTVRGSYSPETRTAKVTTKQEDIGGHEIQHGIIGDLPEPMKKRFFKAVDKDTVAQKWLAKERAAGRNPDQEEFLAQAGGEEDIRRIRQRDSNLWRDMTAWFRVNVSRTGTGDDVVRWLTNRMTYARTAKTEGGRIRGSTIKESERNQAEVFPKAEVGNNTATKGQVLRNSDMSPFSNIRKELGMPEKSTPEQRTQEIKDTKAKDQDGRRYKSDARYSEEGQESINKPKKLSPEEEDRLISFYDQLQGSVEQRAEAAMKVGKEWFDRLELKVGDTMYTPSGTPIKILDGYIRFPTKISKGKTIRDFSKPMVYAEQIGSYKGNDESLGSKSGFYVDGLTYRDSGEIKYSDTDQEPIFSRVAKSTGREFKQIVDNEFDGAFTRKAIELGQSVKSREELNALLNHAETAKDEFRNAIAKGGDMQEIADLGSKTQFFNEAIGAATGTGSSGDYLRKKLGDGYKPPFPNEKASDAKQERVFPKYYGSEAGDTVAAYGQPQDSILYRLERNYSPQTSQYKTVEGLGKLNNALKEISKDIDMERYLELGARRQDGKTDSLEEAELNYIQNRIDEYQAILAPLVKQVTKSPIVGSNETIPQVARNSEVGQSPTDIDTSSRGFFGRFLEPSFDAVSRVSKPVSEALHNWATRRDSYLGSRNIALNELSAFSPEDIADTFKYHRAMFRGENVGGLKVNEDISRILKEYFTDIREKQIEAGLTIHGREAGKNEWYVPDMLSDKAIYLFTRKAGSAEAAQAKQEWIDYLQSKGEKNAEEIVSEYISALGAKRDNYLSVNFGALRKAIGMGLPEHLREKNAISSISKYGRRAASDLALFQELESRPEIASLLKLKDPRTGEIPASTETSKDISQAEEVRKAMKWVMNSFEASTNPQITSVVRTVNNALLGAATGVRDIVSVPVNALPYITKFSDLSVFWRGMQNLREHSANSLKYAARQKNLDELHWQELLDSPDRWSATFNKLSDALRKYQGRELLEQASRIYTFGIGKELAANNLARAATGDAQATKWLEKFGRIADKEDGNYDINQIAKNFVDRVQGTYDGRGLPTTVMEGGLAPFAALQKWGIEKSNVIYQDVVKPAVEGKNYVPFLSYTLGTILTGASIQELNKLLTGRKPQEADIKETMAKLTPENAVAELTTLMQLGSFAGIVSDLVKAASDVGIRGKTPRNLVSFPTATLAADTAEKLGDVSEALAQGENGFEVLKAFALDVLGSHIQNVRIVSNYTWRKDDVNRSEKFRDLRVFKQLEGKRGTEVPTGVNKYLNANERKFKQTGDISEAVELTGKLAKRIFEKANKNPEEAIKYIENLKGNSYQTMPSPEKLPLEFMRYWDYLKETIGEDKASERVIDYIRQRELNKVKGRLLG
jgi:hypothetical protein